jgi:CRP-like cAMP-binding protein
MGARPVTATYTANEDSFCLAIPAGALQALAAASPPLADFLNRKVMRFLDLSRRAVQATWASQTLAEQSLEARLVHLARAQGAGLHRRARRWPRPDADARTACRLGAGGGRCRGPGGASSPGTTSWAG